MRRLAIALLLVIAPASGTLAQRVSMPTDGLYLPGRYIPLRIEAQQAGLIRIRAEDSLGIDWPAPGRGSVVVPWTTWRSTAGEIALDINGQPQFFTLAQTDHSLRAGDPDAQRVLDLEGPLDRTGGMSQRAYAPTYEWSPGRPGEQRRAIVWLALVALLLLGAMRLLPRRSRVVGSLVAALVLSGVIVWRVRPQLEQRAVLVASPLWTDAWVYHAGEPGESVHSDAARSWVVPRSLADLREMQPVLTVDPTGRPAHISATVPPGGSVAFVHRLPASTDVPEGLQPVLWASSVFTRPLYGQRGRIDDRGVIRIDPAP